MADVAQARRLAFPQGHAPQVVAALDLARRRVGASPRTALYGALMVLRGPLETLEARDGCSGDD